MILSVREAQKIAAMRVVAKDARDRIWSKAWNAGDKGEAARLGALATEPEHASDALFAVLNTASSYCDCANAGAVIADAHSGVEA